MFGTIRASSSASSAMASMSNGSDAAAAAAAASTGSSMSALHAQHQMASAQEQASADLVLLNQNLGKSKRVTARMTGLLTSFDDRLARLDKAVVPIHRSTKDLSKIQRNIEAALLAIEAVVGTNDLVDREQEIIDTIPGRDSLGAYQASLNRLRQAMESMEKSSSSAAAVAPNNGGGAFAGVKGKEREGTLGRVRGLIDVGCRKLGGLFLETAELASPKAGWQDIGMWDPEQGPFPTLMPSSTVEQLVALLAFVQSILGQGSSLEKDLQRGYGEQRGIYMAATLNYVGREAIDGVEVQTRAGNFAAGRLPAFGRRGFGRFLDAMFAMAKSEHALAGAIFGKHQANQIHRYLVPPVMTIFTATGTAINASLKRTLTTNATSVGVAFTCYVELTAPSRIDTFEDWIRSKSGRKDNELNQMSHAFKGSCLRSLPEFLEETKGYGTKTLSGQEQTNAATSPTTINVVNFAKQLCEFPDTVEQFLQTLGEGKWMPAGLATSRGGGTVVASSSADFVLMAKYLGDVINTLLHALDARARALSNVRSKESGGGGLSHSGTILRKEKDKDKDKEREHGNTGLGGHKAAGIAAIFSLNNITFIRRELLLNSNIPDLLASGGSAPSRRDSSSTSATGGGGGGGGGAPDTNIEDELNRRNRAAKTSHLEIFSPLVSCLMDAGVEHSVLKSAIGVGNTEKKDTKDRFQRFNEALEEIEQLHRTARLDRNDETLRERVKDEVIRMCVPTYTRFVQRHENFSKNPSKYLKIDPAGLEQRLGSLFA